MKASEYLSIGTVVKLKGIEKRAVISGIHQSFNGNVYDYRAVSYPEGYMDDEQLILFWHSDIETIYMLGYTDREREQMIKALDSTALE